MTKKEKEIYDFTKRHMKENNLSPFGGQYFSILAAHFLTLKWKMY